jgi:hypothetical protein
MEPGMLGVLRFSISQQLTLTAERLALTPGVGGQDLVLYITATAQWLDKNSSNSNAPLLVSAALDVGAGLKRLSYSQPHILTVYGFRADDDLWFPVTTEQLIALDGERLAGGELQLRLRLRVTLLLGETHATQSLEYALRITSAEWVEMLDQLGSEVAITIRVPSPLTDREGNRPGADGETVRSRSQAAARLRQAREHLRDGRPEDCIRSCGLVTENLGLLNPLPSVRSVFETQVESRTQTQRWAALRYDLATLLSGAHHDDAVTSSFRWTKKDAEVALALTAALTALVFEQS